MMPKLSATTHNTVQKPSSTRPSRTRAPAAPVERRGVSGLADAALQAAVVNPRKGVPVGNMPDLERRFARNDGLWASDRQMMSSALADQIRNVSGQEFMHVNVNGKAQMLSKSMALEQLQLFAQTALGRSGGPAQLSPLMHASLQLWYEVSTKMKQGSRVPPFLRELNKEVASAILKHGSHALDGLSGLGKIAVNARAIHADAVHLAVDSGAKKISAKAIEADTVALPVEESPASFDTQVPAGRALKRRFGRTEEGVKLARDVGTAKAPVRQKPATGQVERPAQAQAEAEAQLPMKFSEGLKRLGPVIKAGDVPSDDDLLRLAHTTSKKSGNRAIAALKVEGGRMLLMTVERLPQYEPGIKLAARKLRGHPAFQDAPATNCVLVKDLNDRLTDFGL